MTSIKSLKLKEVSYKYPRATDWALRDINLELNKSKMLVLTGPSGCGKSTLLRVIRNLHVEFGGEFRGHTIIDNEITNLQHPSQLGCKIGIIFQNPAYQLHQPRVIDEIMSAPMYQGLPWEECIRRAQYVAERFVNDSYLTMNPAELSSGEQQKVVLAAALAMKADILLLDEPFSYLDTTAAENFFKIIKLLKKEGKTIILATHDLESVAAITDKIAFMIKGQIVQVDSPKRVIFSAQLNEAIGQPLFAKVGDLLFDKGIENNQFLGWQQISKSLNLSNSSFRNKHFLEEKSTSSYSPVIQVSEVSYFYPNQKAGVQNITLDVNKGEIIGLIGRNGSGKSTLAKLLVGLMKPQKGNIKIKGKELVKHTPELASNIGYVPQFPGEMFFETSVIAECSFGPLALSMKNPQERAEIALSKLGLNQLLYRDPRSLSAGQQRLLSIANVLANNPQIIILDEPEFGLDRKNWLIVIEILRKLRKEGKTIIIITHNLELTLFLCDRLAIMGKNTILKVGLTSDILTQENLFKDAGLVYSSLLKIYNTVVSKCGSPEDETQFIKMIVDLMASRGK